MKVGNLVREEDFDSAPEAPDEAFAYLSELAGERLDSLRARTSDDEEGWHRKTECEYLYMNVIVGLAKSLDLSDLKEMAIPARTNFDSDAFTQFKSDIDHYVTQVMVKRVLSRRRDSILTGKNFREELRTELHHLKSAVDNSRLPEGRKAALHEKIRDFEAILDKPRLNIVAVGRVVFEILSLTANVASVADSATIHKLLTSVQARIGAQIAQQKADSAVEGSAPRLIEATPPKKEVVKSGFGSGREVFPADLDDEIPF
jgi:hypothetical protein